MNRDCTTCTPAWVTELDSLSKKKKGVFFCENFFTFIAFIVFLSRINSLMIHKCLVLEEFAKFNTSVKLLTYVNLR